jgi:hypothetical protein
MLRIKIIFHSDNLMLATIITFDGASDVPTAVAMPTNAGEMLR